MAQLIDKAALVAEIERRLKGLKDCHADRVAGYAGEISALERLLSFIDTLEVKEVDYDKEITEYLNNFENANIGHRLSLRIFAKHFLELGMRVSNPVTAADRGTAEEIIINLKRVEQDYHIDLTREMEWLRNLMKKGE